MTLSFILCEIYTLVTVNRELKNEIRFCFPSHLEFNSDLLIHLMTQTTPVITKLRKTEIHIGSKSRGVNGPTQWDCGFLKGQEVNVL